MALDPMIDSVLGSFEAPGLAVLERLRAEFPDNARLRSRLARADATATPKTTE